MSERPSPLETALDVTGPTQQQLFDAKAELALARECARVARRRKRTSVLDPHRDQILALRAEGLSFGEIAGWYRRTTGEEIARSSILRFITRCLGGRHVKT
jgi:hypothetical protein